MVDAMLKASAVRLHRKSERQYQDEPCSCLCAAICTCTKCLDANSFLVRCHHFKRMTPKWKNMI